MTGPGPVAADVAPPGPSVGLRGVPAQRSPLPVPGAAVEPPGAVPASTDASLRPELLTALLDATPEGVLVVDALGGVRTANAVAAALVGHLDPATDRLAHVLPGHALGTGLFAQRCPAVEQVPAVDPGSVAADAPDGLPGGAAPRGVVSPVRRGRAECRGADGRAVPVEVTVRPLDPAGPYHGVPPADAFLVLVRDLSAAVETEGRLLEQQRLTQLVLSCAGDGIVGSDRDGVVLFANPAAGRILRCSESDLVGRRLHDVAHHTRADGTPYPVDECPTHTAITDGEEGPPREDLFWRLDGTSFPVEMGVAPMAAGDVVVGAVTTFRDVSVRTEVDRLKSEFVGVVSHELRTPLTSIRGSLGLLRAGIMGEVTAEQLPLLEMALGNADRLGKLVDDILDMERLEAGRMPLRPVVTDAADVARQVTEALRPAAQVAGVTLRLTDGGAAPGGRPDREGGAGPAAHASGASRPAGAPLLVDPDRLGQALTNLVGNAIKFTGRDGEVTVHVARTATEVRLEVHDTGPGIPASRLSGVFDRFVQVDGPGGGTRHGTGLGLPITKGIVERSHGRVEVRSEVGVGSVFTIVLPALEDGPGGAGR